MAKVKYAEVVKVRVPEGTHYQLFTLLGSDKPPVVFIPVPLQTRVATEDEIAAANRYNGEPCPSYNGFGFYGKFKANTIPREVQKVWGILEEPVLTEAPPVVTIPECPPISRPEVR